MLCSDTGHVETVHFEHLDLPTAKRLNSLLGRLKRAKVWNARILLFLNGGRIDGMEPTKLIKLPDD